MKKLIIRVMLFVFCVLIVALIILVFIYPDEFKERFVSITGTVFGFITGIMINRDNDEDRNR